MWRFIQRSGAVIRQTGEVISISYSGHGDGKNNPAMQDERNIGPIPVGFYTIGEPVDTQMHGPYVLSLTPDAENEMHGRDGFLWHGDSNAHPGGASNGCIVSPWSIRKAVWAEDDSHRLEVVAEPV